MKNWQEDPEEQDIRKFVKGIEEEHSMERLQRWVDNAQQAPDRMPVWPATRRQIARK
jgi:hypothetical protein